MYLNMPESIYPESNWNRINEMDIAENGNEK